MFVIRKVNNLNLHFFSAVKRDGEWILSSAFAKPSYFERFAASLMRSMYKQDTINLVT